MRQSQLFTKTRKEAPQDEVSKNAILLTRAGFIHKEMAGVYDYLPLGLKVIDKIKNVVRQEMNSIGGQEILMSSLQRKELWEKTDRWNDEIVDVWFKSVLKNGADVGFGWSHEEPITDMMKNFLISYRDLPVYTYQFQNKLRNELRAKSGVMRGREFLMKDMYTYTTDEESHNKIYQDITDAYMRVFERVGLGDRTFLTYASGGAFTDFSHEFQTVLDNGEDTIYLHRDKKVAINKEVFNEEVLSKVGIDKSDVEEVTSAEVGNIFSFGGKKSEELGLFFQDESGTAKPVILGSYGIGISRLMGTVAEALSDDKGLVWPKSIAPFDVHVIEIGGDEAKKKAEHVVEELEKKSMTVLYDDRDARAGEKFADADLIGIPYQIIVSDKGVEAGTLEIKERATGEVEIVPEAEFLAGGYERIL